MTNKKRLLIILALTLCQPVSAAEKVKPCGLVCHVKKIIMYPPRLALSGFFLLFVDRKGQPRQ